MNEPFVDDGLFHKPRAAINESLNGKPKASACRSTSFNTSHSPMPVRGITTFNPSSLSFGDLARHAER